MEITHIGHSCFKIKGKEVTLVIDPYDPKIGYRMPKQECDVLLLTHDHYDHANVSAVSGYSLKIDGPGEYEKSGVFIQGIPTNHDDKKGSERGKNIIYTIDIDGVSILHLGDLGHELSDETMERIASVDVLMIPVGGVYTIDAKTAAEVISEIEPGYVIPMHYKTQDLVGIPELTEVNKFLDEMGVGQNYLKDEKLKIMTKADVPDETQVMILTQQH